jgi:hypothetical protein
MMPTTTRGIRYPVLTDTANVPRDIGYTAADVETWFARTRRPATAVRVDNVANASTLTTIVIPAQPLACRIMIRFGGQVGFGATATFGAYVTSSAGALTENRENINLAAGAWGTYAYEAYVTLAASTATTITLLSYSSSGNSYVRGMFTADILYTGEFA